MKTKYMYCLAFCLLVFVSIACKKEDPLPATTGEGKNVFACYVNSNGWKPYSADFKANTLSTEYYKGTLSIGARRSTEAFFEEIFIVLGNVPLSKGTYTLSDSTYYARYKKISRGTTGGNIYTTDLTHVGSVTITKVDQSRRIVTGTFSFKAQLDNGSETVNMTDGRYDLTY